MQPHVDPPRCRKCRKELAPNAVVCPYCGAQRNSTSFGSLVRLLLFGLGCLSVVVPFCARMQEGSGAGAVAEPVQVPDVPAWAKGGTLHKSTAAEWNAATPEHRLATAGDFVATLHNGGNAPSALNFSDLEGARRSALEMRACLDNALRDLPAPANGMPVHAAAATCALLIGQQDTGMSNARECCKVCSKGKACGDSCITRGRTCHRQPGCACDSE